MSRYIIHRISIALGARIISAQADTLSMSDDSSVEIPNTNDPWYGGFNSDDVIDCGILQGEVVDVESDPEADRDLEDANIMVSARILGGPRDGEEIKLPKLSVRLGVVGLVLDEGPSIARVLVGARGTPQLAWDTIRPWLPGDSF